jgi:Uma2 family endonuclease
MFLKPRSLTQSDANGKNDPRERLTMSILMRIPEGKIILTYEDYVLLPNDSNRYELLEGELSVTPAPNIKHQSASANLFKIIAAYVDQHNLGKLFYAPTDLILDRTSILQPDILFVSTARNHIITEKAVEGPADLVIEILSPTTSRTDRVTKAQIYARHKVPTYWIVDPEQQGVEIYLLTAEGYRLETTLRGESPMAAPPFGGLKIIATNIFI